jgi:hypothetical protein
MELPERARRIIRTTAFFGVSALLAASAAGGAVADAALPAALALWFAWLIAAVAYTPARAAALLLPPMTLAALIAIAVLTGSTATHPQLVLFVLLALAAAALCGLGARCGAGITGGSASSRSRIGWGIVSALGASIGLLWIGEAIAVVVLNW